MNYELSTAEIKFQQKSVPPIKNYNKNSILNTFYIFSPLNLAMKIRDLIIMCYVKDTCVKMIFALDKFLFRKYYKIHLLY